MLSSAETVPHGDASFRQLRHQTKNALQTILSQIAQCRELQATPHGQRLVGDLERRVRLSSAVSDALFGVTSRPGPLPERLRGLSDATVELLGDPDQIIRVEVAADADIPGPLHDTVLRIAHEFIGNAVKHGLYARMVGAVTVRVTREARRAVRLQVLDDGWGFLCVPTAGDPVRSPVEGEGMRLAALLAEKHRGTVSLVRRGGLTVAEAMLHPG